MEKKRLIKNDYYKAKWQKHTNNIKQMLLLLIIFNIIYICLTGICTYPTQRWLIVMVLIISDVIFGLMYRIAFCMPCVRWDLNYKRQDEYVDITERQKRFSTNVIKVMIGLMVCATVLSVVLCNIRMEG